MSTELTSNAIQAQLKDTTSVDTDPEKIENLYYYVGRTVSLDIGDSEHVVGTLMACRMDDVDVSDKLRIVNISRKMIVEAWAVPLAVSGAKIKPLKSGNKKNDIIMHPEEFATLKDAFLAADSMAFANPGNEIVVSGKGWVYWSSEAVERALETPEQWQAIFDWESLEEDLTQVKHGYELNRTVLSTSVPKNSEAASCLVCGGDLVGPTYGGTRCKDCLDQASSKLDDGLRHAQGLPLRSSLR